MSTLLLPPRPPWVLLDLDTTAPVLSLTAPGVVQPPDRLVALLTSDEPLSALSVSFATSRGETFTLGPHWLDDSRAEVALDTVGMASGRGCLKVLARDLAGNVGSVEWAVLIDRPRLLDCEAQTWGAFSVDPSVSTALATDTDVTGAFAAQPSAEHTFETQPGAAGAFETETEMEHDG